MRLSCAVVRDMGFQLTMVPLGFCNGNVSTGFIQATPGDIKSLRSSAERIALIALKRKQQRLCG